MADRKANDVGFDLLQRTQIAVGQIEGDADRLAVDHDVAVVADAAERRFDSAEIGAGEHAGLALDRGAEQHVLQLADIARPGIGGEQAQRVVGDADRSHAGQAADAREQVTRERADVAAALRKRGQGELRARQRVEEVFAKMARLDQLVERAGARRDDADVDALADRTADHLHLARVQEFDELRLRFERDALDMVDDDAAAVGLHEPADLTVERARKGTAFVAEQSRSDQARRHRRAIDHDKLAAGARAGAMDRARKDFLAGAGLAVDHHRHACARGLRGDRERAAEIGARPDDFLESQWSTKLFGERAQFALRTAGRHDAVERFEQPVGRDRFLDEVARPGAHRADRDLDPVAHRDDDERQRGAPAAQLGDEFGDVHARRALIDEHRVERHAFLRAELGERGVGVGRDDAAPAAARRQGRQETLLGRFAVDDHHHSRVARVRHRFESAP